ncbi:MAG: hypothetical protein DDT19_01538 [Syntrophomonadaceae bacterium]|nr:hypothetical protein [Bacillota bacterium]
MIPTFGGILSKVKVDERMLRHVSKFTGSALSCERTVIKYEVPESKCAFVITLYVQSEYGGVTLTCPPASGPGCVKVNVESK